MPNEFVISGGRGNTFTSYGNSFFQQYINNMNATKQEYQYIKSHDYVPEYFNFHKVDNEDELYLGVELEIDSAGKDDKNAKMVVDFLGDENVYCKHDGSLSAGFEIVTHPCTYEYHRNLPYEDLFRQLTNLGYRSHDVNTCGLHVHFNRNYFAKDKLSQDLCISKLLYIFEKYWDKVVLVARRDSNTYARRFNLSEDETILDMYAKSKNSDKYGVINLKHKNTVEIRIFKGTLNYRTFVATLMFVKQMVNIVKNIDIYDIQSLTWDAIFASFDDDLKKYIRDREENAKTSKNEIKKDAISRSYDWSVDLSLSHFMENCPRDVEAYVNPQGQLVYEYTHEVSANCLSRTYLNLMNINDMSIEQVKQKMKYIKQDLRRANSMEKITLQRELQKYAERLGELRRQLR